MATDLRTMIGVTARGLRNNNPFNLVITNIAWRGKVIPSQDSRFETFEDVGKGIRAGLIDIGGDVFRDGNNTIRGLINEFAPPSENPTSSFVDYVAATTGIGPDEIITNPASIYDIGRAIMYFENGGKNVTGMDQALKAMDDLQRQKLVENYFGVTPDDPKKNAIPVLIAGALLAYLW